jgi:MSHA biogenesis protein MshP
MRPELPATQRGFGLVAALFLIVVVAGVVAAMARLAITQHSTTSLALQQARAYQAARAGLEWGIPWALDGHCSASSVSRTFELDGYVVRVKCGPGVPSATGPSELIPITSTAEYSVPGSPDHVYRQLEAALEK